MFEVVFWHNGTEDECYKTDPRDRCCFFLQASWLKTWQLETSGCVVPQTFSSNLVNLDLNTLLPQGKSSLMICDIKFRRPVHPMLGQGLTKLYAHPSSFMFVIIVHNKKMLQGSRFRL